MIPPGLKRQHVEHFARLLDDGAPSRGHAPHPVNDEAALAALGRRLAAIDAPGPVDPKFRANLRSTLVTAAQRAAEEQRTPVGARARALALLAKARTLIVSSPDSRRVRTRTAIIAAVAAGAITVTGISTASDSVPGDVLYGMKRSTERAQLALVGTDIGRGELLLEFARARLREAAAVRDDRGAFVRLLAETDGDTTQGVSLLTRAAAESGEPGPLDTVARFVSDQKRELARLRDDPATIDTHRVRVSLGLLDRVDSRIKELRASLLCGPRAAGPNDELGAEPVGCTSGTGPTDGPQQRRTDDRVTTSGDRVPAAGAGTGGVPVPAATASGEPVATASTPGKSRDPQPRPSRSHP